MDITTFCEKKYLITNTIQELYDEHTRSLEVLNQYKCENELEKKSLILTIKKQGGEIKNRDNTINRLEEENSKKNKQISEYEKMIRDLEDKMNELLIEKEEENRFDMIRNQSNTIQEKENEIIRLTNLLKKREVKTDKTDKIDKTDNKIVNVLDSLVSNDKEETIEVEEVSDDGNPDDGNPDEEDCSIEVTVVKTDKTIISTKKATDPDEDELIYGENAADIAADRMAAHIDDQPSDEDKQESEKEEAYEIIVFTDGACSNNGKPNAKAGIGVYFEDNIKPSISKRIKGIQTNNIAELKAILEVFNVCEKEIINGASIKIYSDSKIAIGWCTTTGAKYEKNNWKKNKVDIPHIDYVKEGYELFKQYKNVSIEFIKAHTSNTDKLSLGNNEADKLATESLYIDSESDTEEESDDEEYECLTYRGKQYWILVGEEPQYVYEIVGEDNDEVGDKLGVYKKTAGGKMKVVLDKK